MGLHRKNFFCFLRPKSSRHQRENNVFLPTNTLLGYSNQNNSIQLPSVVQSVQILRESSTATHRHLATKSTKPRQREEMRSPYKAIARIPSNALANSFESYRAKNRCLEYSTTDSPFYSCKVSQTLSR